MGFPEYHVPKTHYIKICDKPITGWTPNYPFLGFILWFRHFLLLSISVYSNMENYNQDTPLAVWGAYQPIHDHISGIYKP